MVVPTIKTFTFKLKLSGNCLTGMVSLLTCPIVSFVASLTISLNLNPLFTQFLKKCLFLPSLHCLTLSSNSQSNHRLWILLIHISTFDFYFAPLHASPLSFLLKIKSPSLSDLVLYAYLIVDAVPRRMCVKPRTIYTPEYQNTWESLL